MERWRPLDLRESPEGFLQRVERTLRVAIRLTPAQVVVARRWLLGELDDQVALPCGWVCDMLGIDRDVLAAAGRARALP